MNSAEVAKAIELLEKSEHPALVLPPNPSLDVLASAEVLLNVLEQLDKKAGLLSPAPSPDFPEEKYLRKIFSALPPPREFIISIDSDNTSVGQLRYEKTESGLEVILSPKSTPIKENYLSFREGKVLCDCLVALGIDDLINSAENYGVTPDFFTETPIVNIDFSGKNKNYGEINLLDSNRLSISEVVYDFISSWRPEILDRDSATLLLAGILDQGDTFHSPAVSADILLSSSELLRLEASYVDALRLAQKSKPLSLLQFYSRAIIRTKNGSDGFVWSFLTEEDFEKTGRGEDDLEKTFSNLSRTFPSRKILVLLWQNREEKTVRAWVSAGPELLAAIAEKEEGTIQGSYLKIAARFYSFREAEEKLGTLFREIV